VSTSPFLLEASEISKRFPGVHALDQVSLRALAGEVLAVVGENGAGKSTLMKILAGIYPPDGGTIRLAGRAVRFGSVSDALREGISLIHQELNLAENLSVEANLFLGREPRVGGWLGVVDRRRIRKEAQTLLRRVGLSRSPEATVGDLPPGQRQLVEIARALSLRTQVLIMDEPTSSLTNSEADRLFEVIADLKRSGVAVIYISHRLGEVGRVADRVTVLRDGRNAGELGPSQISHDAMVRLMVGRDVQRFFQRSEHRPRSVTVPRLEVRQLRYSAGPDQPVSFVVRPGEIVGMAGLVGAGRTELAEAIFGIRTVVAGDVLVDGRVTRIADPKQAMAAGLVLVPEDRRSHGLFLEDSVQRNIGLPNLDRLRYLQMVAIRREAALARKTCDRLNVRTSSLGQTVETLSGGNQQKIVLGKWLARQPRVVILDEPTRGIDVGAKSEIYGIMDQLVADGAAILMISSDLEEILGMSDRVLVLHQGRLAGELERSQVTEEAVAYLATGGNQR
jgi:ribose transport system ATP-binding protein